MVKRIRIAVIGARSSGKSYLLYDMIHAFEQLGYRQEELPLSYPHSSFGAYFYDTFNDTTGGLRGTERYACRPENHYGAYLSSRGMGRTLAVDFLNIPGEVFKRDNSRLNDYFELKQQIEKKPKGLFWLQEWRSPSKHVVRLIVPPNFTFDNIPAMKASPQYRHGNYLQWAHMAYELQEGQYTMVRTKSVSGRYLLNHLTELHTDSVLLTIGQCWPQLTQRGRLDLEDYKANLVLHYFYPLHFCGEATDIIICDKLAEHDNAGSLIETVANYMSLNKHQNPHVYVAFRGADLLLKNHTLFSDRSRSEALSARPYLRNDLYSEMARQLTAMLRTGEEKHDGIHLPDDCRRHILQTIGSGIGNAFWHLLNASVNFDRLSRLKNKIRGSKSVYELSVQPDHVLPPHVYFTSTPIDTHLRIYQSDSEDVTRFYCEECGHVQSFNQTIRRGNSQHLCFGSYQLLTDVLWQNCVYTNGLKGRSALLLYAQSKL